MEKLTQEGFNEIFTSLLTEREELSNYVFTEITHPIFGYKMIRVSNGEHSSDIVLDGFYNLYVSGESIEKNVEIAVDKIVKEIAADKIVKDFMKKEQEETTKNNNAEVDDELNKFFTKLFGIDIRDTNDEKTSDKSNSNTNEATNKPSKKDINDLTNNIDKLLSSIEDVFNNEDEEKAELLSNVTGFLVHNKHEEYYKSSNCVYSKVMDMLFVYHVGDYTDCMMYGSISNDTISRLNISMTELHVAALENMVKNMPAVKFNAAGNGYVVTNKDARYGAAVILYPDVMDKIAEENKCDLIIVPLSEDAFYVIPNRGCETESLILRKVKKLMSKNQENLVSNNIIRYSLLNKSLNMPYIND